MHQDKAAPSRFEQIVARLPASYRQGKMPYVFLFGLLIIGVLLLHVATNLQQTATPMFLLMAGVLLLLLALIDKGLPLNWAVHIGTVTSLLVLAYAAWTTGGVSSPRLAWLLVLPLTPFYIVGRRAGVVWLLMVWLAQMAMGWATWMGWTPPHVLGAEHAVSSWMTFSLVTSVLVFVPLIYDRLYQATLSKSLVYQTELETKRQELERALNMREHFIANVSHELRTPMNAILGFNALLLSRVRDKPEAVKVLNHTHQSADHLMTVINDILDYSQLQAGQLVTHPETFELRKTVEHAFELFKPRVKSMDIDYRLVLDDALPTWVHTDRHRLMQVLVNLLGNALKFTHQGAVQLQVRWQAPGVEFSVKDTGIGIAKERQAQIFKRFSQAESDTQTLYGGNGLGLAISQKLAHLLGGDIGFESEPGEGSRFWLRLPLTAEEAPGQKLSSVHLRVLSSDKAWTFLVADDHPVNRLLLKQVLQNAWPFSVVLEALDGQSTLDTLHQKHVDLVLMDMVMPVMDGIDATRVIRQDPLPRVRDVPVLGLTANVNPLDLAAFKSAGLSDVMLKPFEPAVLCSKIEQCLVGGSSTRGL